MSAAPAVPGFGERTRRRGRRVPVSTRRQHATRFAVAAASARYIAAGFAWKRDEKPSHVGSHQADGVALGVRSVDLIEVELTPKRAPRYASIFSVYRRRLAFGGEDSVVYLCTEGAARAVRRALSDFRSGDEIADRVRVRVMFDDRGGVLA